MSQLNAFQPLGNSIIIATAVGASTSQETPVAFAGVSGFNVGDNFAGQMRLVNLGTAAIWFNIGLASGGNVAIPTAGTVTTGTPQNAIIVLPNTDITLTLPIRPVNIAVAPAAPSFGFYLRTISTGVSQQLVLQVGEGL